MNARSFLIQWFYPRVRTRVITPFLLAIILVAGLGVFIVTRLVAGSLQERFNSQLLDSATAASNAMVEIEQQLIETLRVMANTQGMPELIAAADVEQIDTLLRPLAANAVLDDVSIYMPDGTGMYRLRRISRPDSPGIDYEIVTPHDVQGWDGAMRVVLPAPDVRGDKFADLVNTDDGATVFISAPIVDDDLEIVAGISAGLRTDNLVVRLAAQALSSVALYAVDGALVGNAFRLTDDAPLAMTAAQAAALWQVVDSDSPVLETTLDGALYQVLYAPFRLRSEPVGILAVGLPTQFINQQSVVSRDVLGALFAGLFIVVAVIGFVVTRSIVRPVDRLADTARAVSSGDLSRRVALTMPDELGELGRTFDRMTDDLVQRNQAIADLLDAQVELTAQREAILASISDAVIFADPAGRLIFQNKAAEHLRSLAVADPEQRRHLDALLSESLAHAEAQTVAFADRYFSTVARMAPLPNGELLGRVTVFRDVSDLVHAERLKDELILQMSHELRTPLTVLRGNVDLLRLLEKNNLSERGVGFLNKTVEHLSTLERLINQVVDVSSMIAGRYIVDRRVTDVGLLLQARAEAWQAPMNARDLRFSTHLPDQMVEIDADAMRLAEVVDHVLRNAYSYTLPGGEVRLCAERQNGHIVILVEDSGVGIRSDEMAHVFERMFRGSAADAGPTDARGMGLGLYLSKHIVEQHDGHISLHSEPGRGTVVEIQLPVVAQSSG